MLALLIDIILIYNIYYIWKPDAIYMNKYIRAGIEAIILITLFFYTQQSRFLALVSNKDILKANMEVANNSEDVGTLQALKALDSIEVKTE